MDMYLGEHLIPIVLLDEQIRNQRGNQLIACCQLVGVPEMQVDALVRSTDVEPVLEMLSIRLLHHVASSTQVNVGVLFILVFVHHLHNQKKVIENIDLTVEVCVWGSKLRSELSGALHNVSIHLFKLDELLCTKLFLHILVDFFSNFLQILFCSFKFLFINVVVRHQFYVIGQE